MSTLASKVCRICLMNSKLVPIVEDNVFKSELTEMTILQKLETLNLDIRQNDGLPQDICTSCIEQLNTSFKFVETSKNSDQILRDQLLTSFIGSADTTETIEDFKYVLTANYPAQVYLLHSNLEICNQKDAAPNIKEEEVNDSDASMHHEEKKEQEDQPNQQNILPSRRNDSEEKKYVCRTCEKVFPKTNSFNWHILQHFKSGDLVLPSSRKSKPNNGGADYECSKCGMCFNSVNYYKLHTGKYHKEVDIADLDIKSSPTAATLFVCRTCSKSFRDRTTFNAHIKIHLKNKDLLVTTESSLEPSKTPNGAAHECPKCGMCFKSTAVYKSHSKKYHKSVEIKTGATYTPQESHSSSTISNYEPAQIVDNKKTDEIQETVYECKICAVGFTKASELNVHIRVHLKNGVLTIPDKSSPRQPNGGAKHECVHCGMVFNVTYFYKLHTEKYHAEKKLFMCAHCNGQFFCRKTLNRHLLQSHFSDNIKAKIEKHTTDAFYDPTSFACSKCRYQCGKKHRLRMHILKKHTEHSELVGENDNATEQHKCRICNKLFAHLAVLKVHINVHILNNKIIDTIEHRITDPDSIEAAKRFECKICHKRILTVSLLNIHMELHIKKGELVPNSHDKSNFPGENIKFECSRCGMGFQTHFGFLSHNKKYHPEVSCEDVPIGIDPIKKFSCAHCFGTSTSKTGIRRHILQYHQTGPNDGHHKCSICHAGFEQHKLLKRHMMEHFKNGEVHESIKLTNLRVQEPSTICTLCGMQFKRRFLMQQHIEDVHKVNIDDFRTSGDEFSKYRCTLCKRNFNSDLLVRQHMLNIHSKLVTWNCTDASCGKRFISERHLLGHVFRVHNNMCCTICNKPLHRTDDFGRHLKAVHGKGRDHLCPLCGKSFADQTSIRQHMECHKAERRSFTCTLCPKTYKTASGLYIHTKNNHEAKKPYSCDYEGCNRSFLLPSYLKYHKTIHTGEKPYKCDYCPMQFRANKHRANHHRTHTGEKPYKCTHENCDKAFAQSYDLTKHLTIHTGEKRHICQHCGEAFRLAYALKTHMKSHKNHQLPISD